jgi:hypothetical protein
MFQTNNIVFIILRRVVHQVKGMIGMNFSCVKQPNVVT